MQARVAQPLHHGGRHAGGAHQRHDLAARNCESKGESVIGRFLGGLVVGSAQQGRFVKLPRLPVGQFARHVQTEAGKVPSWTGAGDCRSQSLAAVVGWSKLAPAGPHHLNPSKRPQQTFRSADLLAIGPPRHKLQGRSTARGHERRIVSGLMKRPRCVARGLFERSGVTAISVRQAHLSRIAKMRCPHNHATPDSKSHLIRSKSLRRRRQRWLPAKWCCSSSWPITRHHISASPSTLKRFVTTIPERCRNSLTVRWSDDE